MRYDKIRAMNGWKTLKENYMRLSDEYAMGYLSPEEVKSFLAFQKAMIQIEEQMMNNSNDDKDECWDIEPVESITHQNTEEEKRK